MKDGKKEGNTKRTKERPNDPITCVTLHYRHSRHNTCFWTI